MTMLDVFLPASLPVIYGNELPNDTIGCIEAGGDAYNEAESGEQETGDRATDPRFPVTLASDRPSILVLVARLASHPSRPRAVLGTATEPAPSYRDDRFKPGSLAPFANDLIAHVEVVKIHAAARGLRRIVE